MAQNIKNHIHVHIFKPGDKLVTSLYFEPKYFNPEVLIIRFLFLFLVDLIANYY